jgi:nicotinate-nucleotide adenylyltransferase
MGGTFDPVHLGHLRVAEETVEALSLDVLLFVPAAFPPHKVGKKILAFKHRWQMLRAATEKHPRFQVSDLEQRRSGKSYTVLTLRELSRAAGDRAELYFVVGLDAFLDLDTWWHFAELFELAQMVVLRRSGFDEEEMRRFLMERVSPLYSYSTGDGCFKHPHLLPVRYLRNTWLDISSTQIRHLVKTGNSIRYLVVPEVVEYIYSNRLYQGDELLEAEITPSNECVEWRTG